MSGYVLAAIALTWRLWAGLGTMSTLGDPGPADNDLFAWFMRYAATAVGDGHLPALVTHTLNAPRGINVMWNTSFLLPSVVLAPVTLLGGPQTSLTIVLTVGYAGSAAAMYWLLRRYGASRFAAGLGGAVYGFSPAQLDSAIGHYNLQFVVLLPLIVEAALCVLTGRGRTLIAGISLGLLVAAELFTEEELVVDTAIACLTLAVALAASRPRQALMRIRTAAAGLFTSVMVALAVCGYALWTQFHGPLTQHGSPFPNTHFGNAVGTFVTPQAGLLFHSASSAAYAIAHRADSGEYLAYLGWPLLIIVIIVIIRYWRDLRVRLAGVTWAVLELLSLGGGSVLLPFHWLQGLPLLVAMLPDRLSILADGAAAAVLAFGLDLVRFREPRSRWRGNRTAAPAALAVLALLPLIPRPLAAVPATAVPVGWDSVFTQLHLPRDASVLVVPAPYSHESEAMRWQADTGEPGELVAGWFIGPEASGQANTETYGPLATTEAVICLDDLWKGTIGASRCSMVKAALAYWHPAAIIADTGPGTPLGRFLTTLAGQPAVQDGQLLAWRT